jgi:hypothetical protein
MRHTHLCDIKGILFLKRQKPVCSAADGQHQQPRTSCDLEKPLATLGRLPCFTCIPYRSTTLFSA